MKFSFKKFLSISLTFICAVYMLMACNNSATVSSTETTKSTDETQVSNFVQNDKDIVVLFTNDVHCGVDDNIGYAGLAEYKKRLLAEGDKYVALVDAGDFSQGAPIGTLSKGKYLIEIMKEVGYDMVTAGNHEFDYNMENFLSNCYDLNNIIFCANFIDLRNNEPVLNPYKIMNFGNKKVALVGVTTPESFTKSTPAYFQDADGNYIYTLSEDSTGEKLYQTVQNAVDDARAEGADYVILVGHLGIDGTTDRWKSTEVIKNTNGIDFLIDGHSHEVINGLNAVNKDGKPVTIAQTGTKLKHIGQLTITKDGNFLVDMIDNVPVTDGSPTTDEDGKLLNAKDAEIDSFIKDIQAKYSESLSQVIVKDNKVDLIINDPETDERIVRKQETNLGDLIADAYRYVLDADIGFMNGGGIRKGLPKGKDITYGDCLTVEPFNNMATMISCKGSVIRDALEHGSSKLPEESGGFLHVSGLTYTIDTTIPSSVVCDEKQNFISVNGEYRVRDIKVNGEDLDLDKEYTLACHDYKLLNGGDGYTMFKGSEVLKSRILPDVDVLVDYLKAEGTEKYSNIYGEGRITIIK